MSSQSQLYATLLLISGVVALMIVALTWHRRHATGGITLALMMAAMVVWSWTYALHWVFPNSPAPRFWLDATYLGVVSIPGLVLIIAIQLSGQWYRAVQPLRTILLIEPVLTLLLLWTDPFHHLFYGGLQSDALSLIYDGGPWFWVNVVYSYTILLIALSLLLKALIQSRGQIYRSQILVFTAGLGILFVVNLLGLFGYHPLPGLDLTPILFTITGLFFAVSISAFRMLDLVPVAQDVLMDQMQDGVIIVDYQGRIIDINQTAADLFEMPRMNLIGSNLTQASASIFGLTNAFAPLQQSSREVKIKDSPSKVLDIQINPLQSTSSRANGFLISWRDITRLKQIESELRKANEILSKNLLQIDTLRASLEEQVIRDPLTGLFNRRFLETILPDEFARAERLKVPISLLVIDIDHFKSVNDRFGHSVGDEVIKHLSRKIETSIRKGDWAIRYGGEEFLAVMIDTTGSSAYHRAEQLRKEIQDAVFLVQGEALQITISIGIAVFPDHGSAYEALFREADRSLYQAKSSGRNRTELAPLP